jgi:L-rhamnose mutarotase
VEEYRARHAAVWPEMRAALSETGWGNDSLFLTEDGTVIGYLETEDLVAAPAAMRQQPVNARWQAEMGQLFAALEGADPDAAMHPIPEIFHLD